MDAVALDGGLSWRGASPRLRCTARLVLLASLWAVAGVVIGGVRVANDKDGNRGSTGVADHPVIGCGATIDTAFRRVCLRGWEAVKGEASQDAKAHLIELS